MHEFVLESIRRPNRMRFPTSTLVAGFISDAPLSCQSLDCDLPDRLFAVPRDDPPVATQFVVQLRITRIDSKRAVQPHEFVDRSNDKKVLVPYRADHPRAELLVSPSQNEPLPSNDCDDYPAAIPLYDPEQPQLVDISSYQ